ncbi:hypothetical protein CU098_004967, partial [Rhizopus stolonifer]
MDATFPLYMASVAFEDITSSLKMFACFDLQAWQELHISKVSNSLTIIINKIAATPLLVNGPNKKPM